MEQPVWQPDKTRSENSNMARFVRFVCERTGNPDIQRYAPSNRCWSTATACPARSGIRAYA
ncbi:MAG: hypothetical protein P8015_20985 [Acidihalobacter sp.]